ncbi:MAG: DUF5011 domain-containing protein [Acholeplasmataceae bacterium]|nr:DUF5011 domain-containing protein [Acholeplasmataceae bacterium]
MKQFFFACVTMTIMFLLIGCVKSPNDILDNIPEIKLYGDAQMTIAHGSEFIDPGAFITNEENNLITITGTVDTQTPGTYVITYAFTYNQIIYEVIRTVIVETADTITFSLNGDREIDIELGQSFVDPGYTISDTSIDVTITGEVDTTTVGTYTLTYTANQISLTRLIHVFKPIYYEINSTHISDDCVTLNLYTTNPYSFYETLKVQIYQQNVFYDEIDLIDGFNSIEFNHLDRGFDYELIIYATYIIGDDTFSETDSIAFFNIFEIEIPLVETSNFVVESTSIAFDYQINDDSDLTTDVNIYVLTDLNQVNQALNLDVSNDSVYFDSLFPNVTYDIFIEVTYRLDDQVQYIEEHIIKTTPQEIDPSIGVSLSDVNFDISNDLYTTSFIIDNPNNLTYFLDAMLSDDTMIPESLASVTSPFSFQSIPDDQIKTLTLTLMYFDQLDEMVVDVFYYTYTPDIYIAPTVSLNNIVVIDNQISFDYLIDDPSSRVNTIQAYLYLNDIQVDSKTGLSSLSDTLVFDNLDYDTLYAFDIKVNYVDEFGVTQSIYALGQATTDEQEIIELFEIISFETDQDTYDLDEVGYLLITISNPENYPIEDVYFGSQSRPFTVEGNVIKVLLETGYETTYERNLSQIYYTVDSIRTLETIYTNFTYTVADMSEPMIPTLIEIRPEYDYFDSSDYQGQTQLNSYVDFIFDNPDDIDIKSITLTNYSEWQWITKNSVSTNQIVRYDMIFNETLEDFSVDSFVYTLEGIDYTVHLTDLDHRDSHSEYCDSIKYLTTVTDLIEMVQIGSYECYILTQDITVGSSYDWDDITDGAIISDIRVYGNGYQISGINIAYDSTIIDVTYAGLFAQLEDSYIYDLTLDALSIDIPNASKHMYVGGIAGKLSNCHLEHINVIGDITLEHVTEISLGGIAGVGIDNQIYMSSTDINFTGSLMYNYIVDFTYVGGLVGLSSDDLYRVSVKGDFNLIDGSTNYNSSIGGLVGKLTHGSIDHGYMITTFAKTMQANYVGGIVGIMDTESFINHVYSNSLIRNELSILDGAATGGLVGYHKAGIIQNSFYTNAIYGSSSNTGLLVGLQELEASIINSYHASTATYNDGSIITPIDDTFEGNHEISSTATFRDKDFYIELGFCESIYDLEDLVYPTKLPLFK